MIMNILLLSALALVSADDFLELPIFRQSLSVTVPAKDGSNGVTFKHMSRFANVFINSVPYITHLEPEFGDLWIYEDQNSQGNSMTTGENLQDGLGLKGDVGVYKIGNVQIHQADFAIPYAVINEELAKDYLKVGGLGLGPKKSSILNFRMPNGIEREQYPNLADQVKSSGYAQSSAFTINLDTNSPRGGNLVYGAMDLSHFTGKLKALPKSPSTNLINAEFTINGINANASLENKDPNSYLDDEVVAAVARDFGAEWDEIHSLYAISAKPQDDLVLNFDGLEIRVPPTDVWVQDEQVDQKWYFTVRPLSFSTVTTRGTFFGADILKSIYIVYDLEHDRAAIGQAVQNPGPANYEVIPAEGIPDKFLS